MTVFTVTEFETGDRCGWRREFNSISMMGLEPIIPLKALFIGTLVHKALDVLASTLLIKEPHQFTKDDKINTCTHTYSDGSRCGLLMSAHAQGTEIYNMYAWEKLNAIKDNYKEKVGVDPSGEEMRSLIADVELGRAMFTNYLEYWGTPLPPEFEYVSTEQSVILELPDTEHCVCSYGACTCSKICRMSKQLVYTYCACINTDCSCRQHHQLEATIDGLVRRKNDGWLFILENKTFTYHPTVVTTLTGELYYPDFMRNHQFMGYTWAGQSSGLEPHGILYNGLWKRESVPNKRTWDDMFLRTTIPYQPYEIAEWGRQASIKAMQYGDPRYVPTRTVNPVTGCKGVNQCNFLALCDARFKNINYQTLLTTKYQKRERTSIFEDEVNAE